jgi:hypothetical protein
MHTQPLLNTQPAPESKKLFEKNAPLTEKANKIYLHVIKKWYMLTEEEKLQPGLQENNRKQIEKLANEIDLELILLVLEEILKEPEAEFFKKIINGISTDEQGLASLIKTRKGYGFFFPNQVFNDSLCSLVDKLAKKKKDILQQDLHALLVHLLSSEEETSLNTLSYLDPEKLSEYITQLFTLNDEKSRALAMQAYPAAQTEGTKLNNFLKTTPACLESLKLKFEQTTQESLSQNIHLLSSSPSASSTLDLKNDLHNQYFALSSSASSSNLAAFSSSTSSTLSSPRTEKKINNDLSTPFDSKKTPSSTIQKEKAQPAIADLTALNIVAELKKWHSYTDEEKKPHREEFTQKINLASLNIELKCNILKEILKIESSKEFMVIALAILEQKGATRSLGKREDNFVREESIIPLITALLERYSILRTETYFKQCLIAPPETQITPPLGVTPVRMLQYIERQLPPKKALQAYKMGLDPATALGKFFKEFPAAPSRSWQDTFKFYAFPTPLQILKKKFDNLSTHLQKRSSLPQQSSVSIPMSTLGGSKKEETKPTGIRHRRATR